jgi:hypothetical protein
MFLPSTYLGALILMVAAMMLWGLWSATERASRPWRFELYAIDFTLGVALSALAAAFTLGVLNSKEISFSDNFLLTGYRKVALGVIAGALANIGSLFLLAAGSITKLAMPLILSFGFALLLTATGVSVLPSFFEQGLGVPGRPAVGMLFGGLLLLLAALVAAAVAGILHVKPAPAGAGARQRSGRRTKDVGQAGPVTAVVLSLLSGGAFALAYPLVNQARWGDNGVSPYGLALLLAGGVFVSSIPVIGLFMFVPVRGEVVGPLAWIRGGFKAHVLGLLGGVLWTGAWLTALLSMSVPTGQAVPAWLRLALWYGAGAIGAALALWVFKDFDGAKGKANGLIHLGLLLYLLAGALFSAASLLSSK